MERLGTNFAIIGNDNYLLPDRGRLEGQSTQITQNIRRSLANLWAEVTCMPREFAEIEPMYKLSKSDALALKLKDLFWRVQSYEGRKVRVNNFGVFRGDKTPDNMFEVHSSRYLPEILRQLNAVSNVYPDGARTASYILNPCEPKQVIFSDDAYVDFWVAGKVDATDLFHKNFTSRLDYLSSSSPIEFRGLRLSSMFLHGYAYTIKWGHRGEDFDENKSLLSKARNSSIGIRELERLYQLGAQLNTDEVKSNYEIAERDLKMQLSMALLPLRNEIPDRQGIRGLAFM